MNKNHKPATHLNKRWVILNYSYLVSLVLGMSIILTAALVLQYAAHELPCPLCLLQRLAYFGIAFGAVLSLRVGYSIRHSGLSMLFAIFLLIVSVRQSMLDIIPRPGHHWIGSTVLGLHMPVWSVIISLVVLTAFALKFSILHQGHFLKHAHINNFPIIKWVAHLAMWYLILLCIINFVSIIFQCGFHICHTMYYRL